MIFNEDIPKSTAEKKKLLISHKIAVWDVIASCDIAGSSDTSIKSVEPNDISIILKAADIKAIFCNGAKSFELYNKYIKPKTNIDALKLPSTSPANAACSLEKLYEKWVILKNYTD